MNGSQKGNPFIKKFNTWQQNTHITSNNKPTKANANQYSITISTSNAVMLQKTGLLRGLESNSIRRWSIPFRFLKEIRQIMPPAYPRLLLSWYPVVTLDTKTLCAVGLICVLGLRLQGFLKLLETKHQC